MQCDNRFWVVSVNFLDVNADELYFTDSHEKDDCIHVCLFDIVVTATLQQGKTTQRNTTNSQVLSLGVAQSVYTTDHSQFPCKQCLCTV